MPKRDTGARCARHVVGALHMAAGGFYRVRGDIRRLAMTGAARSSRGGRSRIRRSGVHAVPAPEVRAVTVLITPPNQATHIEPKWPIVNAFLDQSDATYPGTTISPLMGS